MLEKGDGSYYRKRLTIKKYNVFLSSRAKSCLYEKANVSLKEIFFKGISISLPSVCAERNGLCSARKH